MKLITILTFLIPLSVFAQKNIGYDNIEGEIDSIFKYDYEQGYQSVLNIFEKEGIDKILPQLGVLKITEIALKDGKEINQASVKTIMKRELMVIGLKKSFPWIYIYEQSRLVFGRN